MPSFCFRMMRSENFVFPIFVVVDRVVEEEETVVPRANFAELEMETADITIRSSISAIQSPVAREWRMFFLVIRGSPVLFFRRI